MLCYPCNILLTDDLNVSLYFFFTVDDGAILDVQFSEFYHAPPNNFDKIMIEKSLLWICYCYGELRSVNVRESYKKVLSHDASLSSS